jgi:hypothetical protein
MATSGLITFQYNSKDEFLGGHAFVFQMVKLPALHGKKIHDLSKTHDGHAV